MVYTRPMLMVFQEYADTSTTTPSASLPPCIIGPCYHIVDAVEDNDQQALDDLCSAIDKFMK